MLSGTQVADLQGNRRATALARYWNAVDSYLKTGDMTALQPFRGKAVRVGRRSYPFVTDRRTLERLARAGEVRFEDIYEIQR